MMEGTASEIPSLGHARPARLRHFGARFPAINLVFQLPGQKQSPSCPTIPLVDYCALTTTMYKPL